MSMRTFRPKPSWRLDLLADNALLLSLAITSLAHLSRRMGGLVPFRRLGLMAVYAKPRLLLLGITGVP